MGIEFNFFRENDERREKLDYDREAVAAAAMEAAMDVFKHRYTEAVNMSTEDSINALKELIEDYGKMMEGSSEALHNEHRHLVEAFATMLHIKEIDLKEEKLAEEKAAIEARVSM